MQSMSNAQSRSGSLPLRIGRDPRAFSLIVTSLMVVFVLRERRNGLPPDTQVTRRSARFRHQRDN